MRGWVWVLSMIFSLQGPRPLGLRQNPLKGIDRGSYVRGLPFLEGGNRRFDGLRARRRLRLPRLQGPLLHHYPRSRGGISGDYGPTTVLLRVFTC